MAQRTNQDNYIISSNPSCIAMFHIIYGVGKVKAARLNSFLLNHPNQKDFKEDFDVLMRKELGNNMITKLPIDAKIRVFVHYRFLNKFKINAYPATRLFQNLPPRGGRSHCNCKTSKHRNPFLALKVNMKQYSKMEAIYKRRELLRNGRYRELEAFDTAKDAPTPAEKKSKPKSR